MNDNDEEQSRPRMLPIVRVERVAYFVDVQLQQLQEVGNPHRWIDFEVPESQGCQRLLRNARRVMSKRQR